jgi:hypothetical protein
MKDAELAAELIARMDRDQEARARVQARVVVDEQWSAVHAIDTENTAWLKTVLDRIGWPRRSDVGEQGALAAWLLAQHADLDPDFQRRCLSLLDAAVRDGEAKASHLAYLTDRVRRGRGEPQLYGTQFWYGPESKGRLEPQPIEDVARLDERRRSVGLEPFAEYERQMRDREESTDR